MQKCLETTTIKVSKEVHARLMKDKNHFQKTIGGGKWSLNDTIIEYLKIINMVKK